MSQPKPTRERPAGKPPLTPEQRWRKIERWLVILACLGLIGAVPLMLGDPEPLRESVYQQMAGMSPGERTRLEVNYAKFQQLKADEQNRYRALDAALVQDDLQHGDLRKTMQTYEDWLAGLSLAKRAEIQQSETDQIKAAKVARFARDQREETTQQRRNFTARALNDIASEAILKHKLSATDMDRVMRLAEDELPDNLRPDAGVKGMERHLDIVLASVKRTGGNTRENWPGNALAEQMAGVIQDETLRSELAKKGPVETRVRIAQAIAATLLDGARQKFNELGPTPDVLEQFSREKFATLPMEQKVKLMQLAPDDFQRTMRGLYLQEHRPELPPRYREVRNLLPYLIKLPPRPERPVLPINRS